MHALIARGNAARGGNWAAAADAYAAALAIDPSLHHIYIQLGHAAKEAKRGDQAQAAYQAAAALGRDTGEAFLYLGHLAKSNGRRVDAVRHYTEAAAYSDTGEEALLEVRRILESVIVFGDATLRRVLTEPEPVEATDHAAEADPALLSRMQTALGRLADKLSDAKRAEVDTVRSRLAALPMAEPMPTSLGDRPLVFDLTDLIAHFRHHRLPTGIQRVQIEVLATALRTQGRDRVHICCFVDGRDHWIGISTDRFLRLAKLASSGSDPNEDAWVDARARLFFNLATDPHFVMPHRAMLVNLGTSWWIYDYFRLIREAKAKADIRYVPFVHDLIPIVVPEHVVRGVIEDFVSWTVGAFTHADAFLVNSSSTGTDLLRVAEQLGHPLDKSRVEVVPLDADFRPLSAMSLPDTALERWNLGDTPYALFVSTIESRKNHVLAFEGWAELIRRHGADRVPRLVCVGRNGWLNDRAFAALDENPGLRAAVTIINQVSDQELALLYRCCRFTIYPSHYEGWGLPITESLCYGRVPVVANNSSLPEAGAGFAILFDSNSLPAFVRAVEEIAFDEAGRTAREAAIEQHFRPRPWARIAGQINAALARFSEDDGKPSTGSSYVQPGRFYPVALYKEPRLWRGLACGELFRVGEGWLWPETTGCRTRPQGGELRLTLSAAITEPRLYLQLRGLAKDACPFTIRAGGQTVASGTLKPGETRWTVGDLPADMDGNLSILVQGDAEEMISMSTGGTKKQFRAGPAVVGFGVCDATNEKQRAIFTGTVTFGDPELISGFRTSEYPALYQ